MIDYIVVCILLIWSLISPFLCVHLYYKGRSKGFDDMKKIKDPHIDSLYKDLRESLLREFDLIKKSRGLK